ncbi:hypothetical protein, conserved in T. vivax [Trypanosoma vivax Y486]|uniref:Uncharacterized protein n=1 Tax=Trypanosoma vivax (strain Y486) TaxID=1055687 RepID=F9WKN8_TRYVY|nr:hypothetical protein, conserved in T. vivax [Trypanosoma vivax Y486]|eukprot:CCD18061.1 hypothetical protein, conserved in T. vivax [Trypanosoma vivax Y486]
MCALAAAVKKEFGTAVEEEGWPKPLDEIVEGENISKALATARTARTLAGDSAREDRDTLEAIALAIEGLAALNATREVVSVAQGQLTLHAQAYVKSIDDCVLKLYSYKKENNLCVVQSASHATNQKTYEGAQKCSENNSLGSAGLAATLKAAASMGQEALVDEGGNCAGSCECGLTDKARYSTEGSDRGTVTCGPWKIGTDGTKATLAWAADAALARIDKAEQGQTLTQGSLRHMQTLKELINHKTAAMKALCALKASDGQTHTAQTWEDRLGEVLCKGNEGTKRALEAMANYIDTAQRREREKEEARRRGAQEPNTKQGNKGHGQTAGAHNGEASTEEVQAAEQTRMQDTSGHCVYENGKWRHTATGEKCSNSPNSGNTASARTAQRCADSPQPQPQPQPHNQALDDALDALALAIDAIERGKRRKKVALRRKHRQVAGRHAIQQGGNYTYRRKSFSKLADREQGGIED